jgi:hypothetical protein
MPLCRAMRPCIAVFVHADGLSCRHGWGASQLLCNLDFSLSSTDLWRRGAGRGGIPLPVPLPGGAGRGDKNPQLDEILVKNFQVPICMSLIINTRNSGTFSSRRQRRLSCWDAHIWMTACGTGWVYHIFTEWNETQPLQEFGS